MAYQTILVLDFGSQFTQLIARRLRELSVYSEITGSTRRSTPSVTGGARDHPLGTEQRREADAPRPDAGVFALGVPTLGICYGMQLMTDALGGAVNSAPTASSATR